MVRDLSAAELLSVWERGVDQPPVARALLLLAAAWHETPLDALADLEVGGRDRRLLELRRRLFGGRLVGLAGCPGCGERLEVELAVDDLAAPEPAGGLQVVACELAGYRLRARLPTSNDLLAALGEPDRGAARARLLERCLLTAERDHAAVPASALPQEVAAALAARMAEADPQADMRLALDCPACGRSWQEPFDIAGFLWSEVDAWAERTLRDVHALAAAYGWSEGEVLALGARRRRRYLELVAE